MKRYGWLIVFLLIAAAMIIISIQVIHQGTAPAFEQAAIQPEKTVELVFMNSWGGLDGRAQLIQELLNQFMEQNPGVIVKNVSVFGDDFLPGIKTRFALGDDPDVFGLWPGSDIRSLIAAGKVAELTAMVNASPDENGQYGVTGNCENKVADKSAGYAPSDTSLAYKNSFNKEMWQYVTFDNRIYGLPVEIIFEALFINTDILEQYELTAPTTYEELLRTVRVLRGKGVIPIAYNSEAEGSYLYQNLVMMLGGKEGVENPIQDGRMSDCYIQAMYLMRELYQNGAFPEDYYTLTSPERNNLFTQKKAAMLVQGSWFIPDVVSDPSVDIIPFPVLSTANPAHDMVYGMGCGIFYASNKAMRDPQKTAAVQKLLRFLTSKQTAAAFAEQTGMISNVDVSEYRIAYNRLTQKGLSLVGSANALVGPADSFIDRTVWEDVIIKQFPHMLQGRITPEELWADALNGNG